MATFAYKAKNNYGKDVQGLVEAADLGQAEKLLREENLLVVSLQEKTQELNFLHKINGIFNRIKAKDLVFLSRQLAVMIGASVPLVKALKILVRQTENPYFKIVIADLATVVEGGGKFSEALKKYPHAFDDFFVQMVKAGETSGRLQEVLDYLAGQEEKDYALNSRIVSALIYPLFILGSLVVIGIIMLVKVVPQLTSVLTQNGVDVPLSTKILIGLSDFLVNYWWLGLIITVILIGIGITYKRTKAGQWYFDYFKLSLPVFGLIFKKIYLTRFSRGLANLLSAGVPITQALVILADAVQNSVYRELILKTCREVESGKSVAEVFMQSKHVPQMVSNMLNIGEESGKLDSVLFKLADFYSMEVEIAMQSLVSLVEPIIMLILGAAVLFLVLSILTPIYNLTSAM